MLTNMFIGKPPGTYDRILDFSTAITGSLFFVPTGDFLDDPPEPDPGSPPDDGSLSIGSLRPD
jgi:putative iron-dependent peroxidase